MTGWVRLPERPAPACLATSTVRRIVPNGTHPDEVHGSSHQGAWRSLWLRGAPRGQSTSFASGCWSGRNARANRTSTWRCPHRWLPGWHATPDRTPWPRQWPPRGQRCIWRSPRPGSGSPRPRLPPAGFRATAFTPADQLTHLARPLDPPEPTPPLHRRSINERSRGQQDSAEAHDIATPPMSGRFRCGSRRVSSE